MWRARVQNFNRLCFRFLVLVVWAVHNEEDIISGLGCWAVQNNFFLNIYMLVGRSVMCEIDEPTDRSANWQNRRDRPSLVRSVSVGRVGFRSEHEHPYLKMGIFLELK